MSTIGFGYGSEWHLLRHLGYHRDDFDRAVEAAIPGSTGLRWLDAGFEADPAAANREPPRFLDREIEGLDFLPAPERERLATAWPRTGSLPVWDAVGRVGVGGEDCWLIVEGQRATSASSGAPARPNARTSGAAGSGSSPRSVAPRTNSGSRSGRRRGWPPTTSSATG